jgi:hypothetical protein
LQSTQSQQNSNNCEYASFDGAHGSDLAALPRARCQNWTSADSLASVLTVQSWVKVSSIEIRRISTKELLPLRHKVLRPHQTLQDCINLQDEWATTFHVGAFLEGQLVGIATFHEESFPELKAHFPYRLRGMATDFSFHKKGIGRQVLEKGMQELRDRHCDLLWCNAREVAFPFYEKLGLTYWEPMFEITGLGPHKVMYKYLS